MSSKSNCIANKIKQFDFLGEGINFSIHNQPYLKTVCGGILRLFLYLIGLFLAFYFSKDFINRTNPSVDFEVKETSMPLNFTFTASDFFFAIKFENAKSQNIDVSDYFHIVADHDTFKINNTEYIIERKNIPMVRCSEIKFDADTEKFFQKENNDKDDFCHLIKNNSEVTISGNFEHFFDIRTTNIKLKLCLDINNKQNKKCKNYKKFFNEFLNNDDLYVSLIINEVNFDRDDIGDPLKKKIRLSTNLMSKNIIKRDYVSLTKTDVIQDDGYILTDEYLYSEYGYSEKRREFYFFEIINSDDDITKMNNDYYSLNIVGDFKYNFYTRKYLKFQNVLALVVSFLNLLISITRGIYAFYYRFRLRTYLFRKLVRIPPDYGSEEGKNKINILNQNSKIELKAASELTEREIKIGNSKNVSNRNSFIGNVLNEQSRLDENVKDSGNRFFNEISKNETNLVNVQNKIIDKTSSIEGIFLKKFFLF